jgi:hypothetical protein
LLHSQCWLNCVEKNVLNIGAVATDIGAKVQALKDICVYHVVHFHKEGDNFLKQIITCNENWVEHYQPETK